MLFIARVQCIGKTLKRNPAYCLTDDIVPLTLRLGHYLI